MWVVVAFSVVALLITYVFGAPEIHWWLSTSANRTTIFAQLALYSDMAVWLAIAASGQRSKSTQVGCGRWSNHRMTIRSRAFRG